MAELLATAWPYLLACLYVLLAGFGSVHAVLRKRDAASAVAWVGLMWLAPLFGALLYGWFGVNRIRRRAVALRAAQPQPALPVSRVSGPNGLRAVPEGAPLRTLARLVERVTGTPLIPGNRIEPLVGGAQAYPEMLRAVNEAEGSVTLATYIFDADPIGRRFVDALTRAVARGVEVRVLVDGMGVRTSRPAITRLLGRAGVPCATFMPTHLPWSARYANLRLHRKLLVVDGRHGFTGGMNIREGCDLTLAPRHPIEDLHFRLAGQVVRELQETFATDWAFATGELLEGERWFPALEPAGPTPARAISDGPDEDFDKLRQVLLGALACAQSRVRIVTPYFLPDAALITALAVTALRGVEVEVFLPAENNLKLIQWASTAQLWQVLERGCRVFATPPPFDHTKLMLVDDAWTLFGSANWDPRSLRLNFELNVEAYDRELTAALGRLLDAKRAHAHEITFAQVEARPLPIRLRDGVARLLSPYL